MAADMKKKSKVLLKRPIKIKAEEVHKVAPAITPGLISLAMSREDMNTFANLVSIAAKTFEKLALQAAQENDEHTFGVLQARHRLSSLFAEKLIAVCRMPEPVSRDFH